MVSNICVQFNKVSYLTENMCMQKPKSKSKYKAKVNLY